MQPHPARSPALVLAHARSLDRMAAVERAARVTLGAVVRRAVGQAARAPGSRVARVVAAGGAVEAGVGMVVARGREAARREGRSTFLDELSAAGGWAAWETPPPDEATAEADQAEAMRAGKAFAAGWLSEALANVGRPDAEQADVLAEMTAATEAAGHRLDAIAASDVAATYNAEREELGAAYARDAGRLWLPLPMRFWDATRDTRLCARCFDLNGTVRPFGVPFPGGAVPGEVHRNCRCSTGLTMVALPLGRGEDAAEAPDYYMGTGE